MSMSQEEIEALMNGADDLLDEGSSEDSAQEELTVEEPLQESSGEVDSAEDNFDDILAGIDGITDDNEQASSDDSLDSAEDNFDDILAGIDGITDDEPVAENSSSTDVSTGSESVEEMIDQNKYPLPVEKEHKVVNQLNEVAEDSEQKASQIFDVLSFVLDENNEIQKFNKEISDFLEKEKELLESLSTKFPNIEIFKEQLGKMETLQESSSRLFTIIDDENMKIFEAMELMQFHDINRQKIERVMSVIRKLNDYLNGIFEDESDKPEVQIAKHISGDSSETVQDDDLEALISEFGS